MGNIKAYPYVKGEGYSTYKLEGNTYNIKDRLKEYRATWNGSFWTLDENELIQETTGLLGGLKNMAGFDPMAMFQNMAGNMNGANGGEPEMPDMSQFAGIFQNLNQTLGETMKNIVEEQRHFAKQINFGII